MNYHNILHDNMLNGEGLRVVLFVSGCEHHCKGCHNPQTHDPASGIEFTQAEEDEIFEQLSKPYIRGLTLTGGDPLHPSNYKTLLALCKKVKANFPKKDIWLYTGYRVEDIPDEMKDIFQYIDTIVDGRFVEELKDVNLPYVGSSNQRIIRLNKRISATLGSGIFNGVKSND